MKEYELYVPLNYNDGSPVELEKLERIQDRLLAQFEGVTFFPQPNQGLWKYAGVTYRDEIVIYRVITSRVRFARRFLLQLREMLKRELKQKAILIVEKDADVLE